MTSTNMTPEAIAMQVGNEIAKHLDGKSDRYVLIYTAVILISVLGWLAWYFLKRQEKLQEKADQRTEQIVQLAVTSQHTADACREALNKVSEVVVECKRTNERVVELLKEIKDK
jgi:hypothetical protein